MTNNSDSSPKLNSKPARVAWRSVALPAEHGGWAWLVGPILLGLLVVPSAAGIFLVLIDVSAYLARTPIKIIWKDLQRGRRYARTAAAYKVLFLYAIVAIFSLTAVLILSGPVPLVPLFLVLPLAAVVLYHDLFANGRELPAELLAPVVLSAVVASMALAHGWDWPHTLAIWAIPLMISVPAVLFIRARLRLDRGQPSRRGLTLAAHVVAALLAAALATANLIPTLAAVTIFILLGRALYGLSNVRRPVAVKTLGWSEVAFSLLAVILSAVGYWGMGI
jgi:hypothetical protein